METLRTERDTIPSQRERGITTLQNDIRRHKTTIDNLHWCMTMLQTPAATPRTATSQSPKVADPEAFSDSGRLTLPRFLKGLGLKFDIYA